MTTTNKKEQHSIITVKKSAQDTVAKRHVFEVKKNVAKRTTVVPPGKNAKKSAPRTAQFSNAAFIPKFMPEDFARLPVNAQLTSCFRWLESLCRCYPTRVLDALAKYGESKVENLRFAEGVVSATLNGEEMRIECKKFGCEQWDRVVERLGENAFAAAMLLNNDLPDEIIAKIEETGNSLFAQSRDEFKITCTCGNDITKKVRRTTLESALCRHLSALFIATAQKISENPSLLFLLRGISKIELLNRLRVARSPIENVEPPKHNMIYKSKKTSNEDFAREKGPLDDFRFEFDSSCRSKGILEKLDNPPNWRSDVSIIDLLSPIYQQASKYARESALELSAESPMTFDAFPDRDPEKIQAEFEMSEKKRKNRQHKDNPSANKRRPANRPPGSHDRRNGNSRYRQKYTGTGDFAVK